LANNGGVMKFAVYCGDELLFIGDKADCEEFMDELNQEGLTVEILDIAKKN
jgi:hypothetical protein